MKEKNKGIGKLLTSICVVLLLAFVFSIAKVSVEAEGANKKITVRECNDSSEDYYTFDYKKVRPGDSASYYYAIFTFDFPEGGKFTFSDSNNRFIYYKRDGDTKWTYTTMGTSLTVQANSTVELWIKGNGANQSGTLTYSFEKTASLDQWASKDSALDITNGYDGTGTKFENTRRRIWYKFTLTKASVITLAVRNASQSLYVDIFDSNNKSQLSEIKAAYTNSQSAMLAYYKWDKYNGKKDDNATLTLYKPGTYYMELGENSGYDGKIKFTKRDYIPITSVALQNGTNMTVSSGNGFEYVENNVTGVYPSNTDGRITTIKYDPAHISQQGNIQRTKGYGVSYIRYYDERGVQVAQAKLSVVPPAVTGVQFEGKTKEISIKMTGRCGADTVRIYQNKGGRWERIASVPINTSQYKVKGLKPETNYQFRLTYYHSASNTESVSVPTFTAGTGFAKKSVIQKVSKIKQSKKRDYIIHNPGRWNERRVPYWVYNVKGTVVIKKVKGCRKYQFSTMDSTKKTKSNVLLASARNSKKKLPKKIKLKVRTVRQINSYAVAYGNWSKAKTVKIR